MTHKPENDWSGFVDIDEESFTRYLTQLRFDWHTPPWGGFKYDFKIDRQGE